MQDDALYALKDKNVQRRRRAMLTEPHMKPLCDFVNKMRAARGEGCDIPDFDPLDGGLHAKVLFLFESPRGGVGSSGFISRENPDGTARIFRELCDATNISREDCIVWNVVPWWVEGSMDSNDVLEGLTYLHQLINILQQQELKVIVLFGKKTKPLKDILSSETKVRVVTTWMPSPQVFYPQKEKKREIEETFQEIARLLRG